MKIAEGTLGAVRAEFRARLSDFALLAKPRITMMVAVTTLVGFYMGSRGAFDVARMLHLLLGTMLTSAGASVLNQYIEREIDGRMRRTQGRPLPSGRMTPPEALLYGSALSIGGVVYLLATVTPLAAALAAATIISYAFLYTPLKQVTTLNTLVGAVPGALPPVGGWAAARGEIGLEGAALFAILFFWQLPHFLAIAWMYREEYARAGLKMRSVFDPEGVVTGRQMILWTLGLVAVSLVPVPLGMAGPVYGVGAAVLGAAFLASGVVMALARTRRAARGVLLASVLYLPLLLILLTLAKSGA